MESTMFRITKKWVFSVVAIATMVMLQGCESLTERTEDVTVTLDTFSLIGNGTNSTLRVSSPGNPSCSTAETSIREQLASADNFDDFDEFLESIEINSVRYRVTQNSTPVEINGSFSLTDPGTGELAIAAAVVIPSTATNAEFIDFPFVENGLSLLQHYVDNLDSRFSYCVQGTPDSSELNLQLELQLDMDVTIDIL